MEELIKQTVDIIGDYRQEDGVELNEAHVTRWINQFNSGDREFILSELNNILPNAYISKDFFLGAIKNIFNRLAEHYGFSSVQKFLLKTKILSCQLEHKSQTAILKEVDLVLKDEYKLGVKDCGREKQQYWLYIDDVIASGGTVRRELETEINKFGVTKFDKEGIKIICVFFILHSWGYSNVKYSLTQRLGIDMENKMAGFSFYEIENNPRINIYNSNPKFNHVFPKDLRDQRVQKYLDNLNAEKYADFAYRRDDYPKQETFYRSTESRDRYESILLHKGLDIIDNIESLKAKGLRPLGMTSPWNKILGTGSHAFTWRNISNTCPLVFWWETNGWHPLFSVNNRGRH